jgi:hypothetical protein
MPPSLVALTVGRRNRRPLRLWLPVFLLWPLLAVLGPIALALAFLVDAVCRASRRHQGHATGMVLGAFATLAEARGLLVRVNGPERTFELTVR